MELRDRVWLSRDGYHWYTSDALLGGTVLEEFLDQDVDIQLGRGFTLGTHLYLQTGGRRAALHVVRMRPATEPSAQVSAWR